MRQRRHEAPNEPTSSWPIPRGPDLTRYKVLVDDNFHYMDVEARFEHGRFDTAEEAITACRNIVDTVLHDNYRPGMSAAELYHRYTLFGEDPFIIVLEASTPPAPFSSWDYARERCQVICGTIQETA
jgi:hypothetical protein